ncbi:hypothetical protein ACFQZT_06615 [Paenibacillus sp. GCM10027628]|uniref:hypothetical protein n=1 Tax=Paenibacillus sp. GCM10027628 TaxID=3273413 RepID=UPI00362B7D32
MAAHLFSEISTFCWMESNKRHSQVRTVLQKSVECSILTHEEEKIMISISYGRAFTTT